MEQLIHLDPMHVLKPVKDEDWVIMELKPEQRKDILCEASEQIRELDHISCNGLNREKVAEEQRHDDVEDEDEEMEDETASCIASKSSIVCQECSKSFPGVEELTDHVKSNHLVRRSHNTSSAVNATERKNARREAASSRQPKVSSKVMTASEVLRKCTGCGKHLVNCQRVSELISSSEVGDLCDDCFVASQLENAVTNADNCLMLTCETHAVETDYYENDAVNSADVEEIDGDLAVEVFDIPSEANGDDNDDDDDAVPDTGDVSEENSSQSLDSNNLGFLGNFLLDVTDKTKQSVLGEVVSLEDAIARVGGDDDNAEMFKCVLCDKLFARHSSVMKHITAIHSNKRLPCDVCGRRFRHVESLQLHKLGHTAEGRYSCGSCGVRFKHRASLARHLESHVGLKLDCPECKKSFSHHADLQQHMRLRHLVKNRFDCQYCDRSFYAAGSLKAHLREHAEEKAYRCRICDKVYQRTDTLRNHMMLHSNEWPFVCAQCGARFRHRLSYYRHIDSHKGRELFTCQHCNKTFKHNNALNEHNRRFHQSTMTVLSVDLSNPQTVEHSVSVSGTVL